MITGDKAGVFFGEDGFSRACKFAIEDEIPEDIREGVCSIKKKPAEFHDWEGAIMLLNEMAAAK